MNDSIALEMRNITKRFGNVVANNQVNLEVFRGEILAILGENGCGKTTLMNMIAGIYYPDEGQIYMNGEEIVISSPKDAFEHGIGMIHQHFKLVDLFTAAENIILGVDDGNGYNLKDVNNRVLEIANKYGFHIDPQKKIYDMSVSEKQTVEIIKVLYRGADILILDEPTASLDAIAEQEIFSQFDRLRKDKTTIFVSHRLSSATVASKIIVLEYGKMIELGNHKELMEKKGRYYELFTTQASRYLTNLEDGTPDFSQLNTGNDAPSIPSGAEGNFRPPFPGGHGGSPRHGEGFGEGRPGGRGRHGRPEGERPSDSAFAPPPSDF